MIGKKLGRFEVVERLDAGGQGEIYRARHEELALEVAVKVLRERSALDQTARKLFLREAHTLAKLKHPHIGAIHDFVSEDDTDYLVMELVPGTDLAERLHESALPEPEVLRLGTQIAQALEEAHEQHIVHLDLKPKNVMVTPKGQVKVLDFGLARLVRPIDEATTRSMTDVHRVAGTLPYMAPEQLIDGADVDARTDVYALGVTLYEMATGRRPFEQTDASKLITAILQSEPARPSTIQAGISSGLERVIFKALTKDSSRRYQTVQELRQDLERCAAGITVSAPRARPSWMNRWALGVGTTALAAAVVVLILLFLKPPPSLAVLPVRNLSGNPEQDAFAEAMHDVLISRLYRISGLTVIGPESSKQFKASAEPLSQIAAALGARYIVQASFMHNGDRVQLNTQLTEASSDRVIWAETFDRERSDLWNLMNELTAFIAERIEVVLQPEEEARLQVSQPVDPDASDAYAKGRHIQFNWTREAIEKAIEYYSQAIEIEPNLVEAHAGLAECYLFLGTTGLEAIPPSEAYPKAKSELRKALEIDPASAQAYAVLGQISAEYDWDFAKAEHEYRRAIELQPSFAMARIWYSQLLSVVGRHDEAFAQVRRAQELEPLDPFIDANVVVRLFQAGDYAGAIKAGTSALETHPNAPIITWFLGVSQYLTGDYIEAVATLENAVQLSGGDNAYILSSLGRTYVRAGMRDKALIILNDLEGRDYVPSFPVAELHAELGDLDAAFAWLEKAYEERSSALLSLKLPHKAVFWGDPRFDDLVRRVGIWD